jgi:hypothetical protein
MGISESEGSDTETDLPAAFGQAQAVAQAISKFRTCGAEVTHIQRYHPVGETRDGGCSDREKEAQHQHKSMPEHACSTAAAGNSR